MPPRKSDKTPTVCGVPINPDDYMTVREAAMYAGLCYEVIRLWIKRHKIGFQFEGCHYVHKEKFNLFLGIGFHHPDYITSVEAGKIAGVTLASIIAWIRKYGIGTQVCGRYWFVNKKKFELLLRGNKWFEK